MSTPPTFEQLKIICERRGIKLTGLREQILQLICIQQSPVGAYDLLRELRKLRPNAEPPTVYRVLEFLKQNHIIHRVESSNAYLLCNDLDKQLHGPLLICKACGTTNEINEPNLLALIHEHAHKYGFDVEDELTEIRGLCEECIS